MVAVPVDRLIRSRVFHSACLLACSARRVATRCGQLGEFLPYGPMDVLGTRGLPELVRGLGSIQWRSLDLSTVVVGVGPLVLVSMKQPNKPLVPTRNGEAPLLAAQRRR